MASPYIKRHILNAIEHLRGRKARPDLHRICNQLKRRHNCAILETTRCVDHLMDMGVVIKVEYKGSMSYRDATKWKKGHVAGHIMNTNTLVAKIQRAIDTVTENQTQPDTDMLDGRAAAASVKSNERGATLEEIETWLKKQTGENACHLTGDALFEVMTREVEIGTLRKSQDYGGYIVGRRVKMTPRQKGPSSPGQAKSEPDLEEKPLVQIVTNAVPAAAESTDYSIDDKRQRPPSGRKRINKFRDEIYEVPPIKKSRKPAQTVPQLKESAVKTESKVKKEKVVFEDEYRLAGMFRLCNEIHQTEIPSRHEGQELEMLVCCGCQMKAHPACLSYSEDLLAKIDRDTWRCVTCKKCAKCDLLLRTPSPMTCSGCDLAYHKSCHKPIMRKKPRDNWLCMQCSGVEIKTEEVSVTALPTKTALDTDSTLPNPVLLKSEPASEVTHAGGSGDWLQESEEGSVSYDTASDIVNGLKEDGGSEDDDEEEEDEEDKMDQEEAEQGDDQSESGAPQKTAKDPSFPPTPNASPLWDLDKASAEMLGIEADQMREDQKVKKVSKFDGQDFPDPTGWTVDQVFHFVNNADACYSEAAQALKREEIDGEALMCLKREEILSNFSLKVGPALKLNRFIINMRTGGNAHMYL